MNIIKSLIKLNNKLEKSWYSVDLSEASIELHGGWYLTEFVVDGALDYVPRIVVESQSSKEAERYLIGSHSGRNRMLIFLPKGRVLAHSESIEIERLARISALEARARVLLICFRYLVDFFSLRAVLDMVAMQFQNRFDLSTSLLEFYSPVDPYLKNVKWWSRFRRFNKLLSWWHRAIKIAVIIEDEAQRQSLQQLFVTPDYVIMAGDTVKIPPDADYVVALRQTEHLRWPAILMLKRALKKASNKPLLVYTDHDYLPAYDKPVVEPVFKPQPSSAYLHCFNYIGPAAIFARQVVFDLPLDKLLQDQCRYQLALQCFANIDRVMHLSEALFCCEQGHVSLTPEPLASRSPWPEIVWRRQGDYNVLVADTQSQDKPSVDLIIPTRDGMAVLKPCVDSILLKTQYTNFNVIVVDNGSELAETHAYFDFIEQDPRVRVINYPGEFNYSAINNFAVAQSNADYVALVNNDIEVIAGDWLLQMMTWAVQDEVGVVGAKLLFGNGKVQHAGVTIGLGNAAGHIHRLEPRDSTGYQNRCVATQNMMAVTAACLVTPRKLFNELGMLDEDQLKVAYNDIDYCLRVEALGKHIIWTPEAVLYHHESVSRGDDMSNQHIERYFKELEVFQKRWKTKGFVDKYYSKHLRISDEGVYPRHARTGSDPLKFIGESA